MSVATEQLGMARYLLEVSDMIADEAEGKRIDPTRKIRVGGIRAELAAKLGKAETELDDDPALTVRDAGTFATQETADAAA